MRLIDADKLKVLVAVENDGTVATGKLVTALFDDVITVEAIPVEWLEQLLDDAELAGQPYTINILKRILSRWEEENGTENN